MDIITRAAGLTDHLVVAVLRNTARKSVFSVAERVELLEKATQAMENVCVESFDGLLADYVRIKQAQAVVRGVRTMADYDIEMQMATMNRLLNPQMDTILLPTDPRWSAVSATWVRDVGSMGGDLSGFVPEAILDEVKTRLLSQHMI
jgi:pantetheine-phosphate adenylyltransferase